MFLPPINLLTITFLPLLLLYCLSNEPGMNISKYDHLCVFARWNGDGGFFYHNLTLCGCQILHLISCVVNH